MKTLSFGAGVQSTCLLLMAEHGEIEKPDFAIFADTGWEPEATYRHIEKVSSMTSIPVVVVRRAGMPLHENLIEHNGGKYVSVPFFVRKPGDKKVGIFSRQCTQAGRVLDGRTWEEFPIPAEVTL